MDDMIAVAVKDNDPRFRGYLPFIPASSSVRMSTLVVLDGPESTESLDIVTDDETEINGKYPRKQGLSSFTDTPIISSIFGTFVKSGRIMILLFEGICHLFPLHHPLQYPHLWCLMEQFPN